MKCFWWHNTVCLFSETDLVGMDEFSLDSNGEFYVTEKVRTSFDKWEKFGIWGGGHAIIREKFGEGIFIIRKISMKFQWYWCAHCELHNQNSALTSETSLGRAWNRRHNQLGVSSEMDSFLFGSFGMMTRWATWGSMMIMWTFHGTMKIRTVYYVHTNHIACMMPLHYDTIP